MSSADWVAKFTASNGTGPQETIRAINAYGKCYDARTDRAAASLVKAGKGPQAAARANFRDFDQSLKDFTFKALAATESNADPVKAAYAALYEKQFRYQLYESFAEKPSPDTVKAPTPAPKQEEVLEGVATATKRPAATPASSTKDASDADPVTQAKNHFGELLGALPDSTMHQLHAAFGEILGSYDTTPDIQLLVYRYAIFLIEPSSGQPFSPPPF